jgi:hypothetical protein
VRGAGAGGQDVTFVNKFIEKEGLPILVQLINDFKAAPRDECVSQAGRLQAEASRGEVTHTTDSTGNGVGAIWATH